MSATFLPEAKRAAVEQWTADPCGPATPAAPGSPAYLEDLLSGRDAYAPWMAAELDYGAWEGESVLDVGCGQGIDLVRYARGGARVTGLDLTPRHVELATAHLGVAGLAGEVVQGDAEDLPFADGSFAHVSSNGVLHHTPDIERALTEIHRVTAPGGDVVVTLYHRHSLHFWLDQVLRQGIVRGGLWRERSLRGILSAGVERSSVGARPLVDVFSRRQVRNLLRRAGFSHVRAYARHLRASDSFLTDRLARRFSPLADPELLDRVGRLAGWYVVGRGVRS